MNLYVKHRPTTTEDFIGNKDTVKSFDAVFGRESGPPQAILITGPSGCGKTTLARIAKEKLNCSDVDFTEYNTADFNGIETIRNIRKTLPYNPMQGDVKLLLIDECHMLTSQAQEAMLKMLEDTPDRVYFILCTTNPEKLKKTIRTRCTEFPVRSLPQKSIKRLVQKISRKEGVKIPEEVADQIALDSTGSSRMALSILEKIIDLEPEDMLESAKRTAESVNAVIELCRALIGQKSWKIVSAIIKGLDAEPETIRYGVLNYANSVLLSSGKEAAADVMANFRNNFYDSKKAGVTLACWDCCS